MSSRSSRKTNGADSQGYLMSEKKNELANHGGDGSSPIAAEVAAERTRTDERSSREGAAAEIEPVFMAKEILEVTAPSDLPEGYKLYCLVDEGHAVTVVVPSGGVRAGGRFVGIVVDKEEGYIPTGRWRDGVCDCCAHGCCHPMCWYTCVCPQFVLGQVMTRMSLNIRCDKGNPPRSSKTFFWMVLLWLVYHIVSNSFYGSLATEAAVDDDIAVKVLKAFVGMWNSFYFWFVLISIVCTRMYIRARYDIPGSCCRDFCCSCCCPWCTVCQMARHTTDYSKHPVACCSEPCCCSNTGTSPHAPEIV